jgi:hypothetical protein
MLQDVREDYDREHPGLEREKERARLDIGGASDIDVYVTKTGSLAS